MKKVYRKIPAETRFHSKYTKSVDPDGCWELNGFRKRGYGIIHVNGVQMGTHRYSYILHKGPIQNGLMVCHRCDNPNCVNPDHLFLGTNQDNMNDAHRKGRLYIPKSPHSKKNHCKHGHEFTPENTMIRFFRKNNTSWRQCAICYRDQYRRGYARFLAKKSSASAEAGRSVE